MGIKGAGLVEALLKRVMAQGRGRISTPAHKCVSIKHRHTYVYVYIRLQVYVNITHLPCPVKLSRCFALRTSRLPLEKAGSTPVYMGQAGIL